MCGTRRHAAAGFSLLEVLVAMTILALGLLGMAALQHEALKYSHVAFLETQAAFLLDDIAERIRIAGDSEGYQLVFGAPATMPALDCAARTCNAGQMAAWDLHQWRARVESADYLPQGEGQVQCGGVGSGCIISIRYAQPPVNRAGGVGERSGRERSGKRTISIVAGAF